MAQESPNSGRSMVEIDGTKIRKIREEKGLTQLYVATVVGVTTDTISRWENRKYPSIKRENGLNLARALDVDLDAIIDHPGGESSADKESGMPEAAENRPRHRVRLSFPARRLVPLVLIGVIALALLLLYGTAERHKPVQVTSLRILPDHAPAGTVFPVIIKVAVQEEGPSSLIVKEELPAGCRAVEGLPPFNTISSESKTLKWVIRVKESETIIYLAEARQDQGTGRLGSFNGEVVAGGKASTRAINGDSSLELSPYHWVDRDRNGMIDDEEILAFYDLFSDVQQLKINRDLIDEIWAAGGYEWDAESGTYRILP